MQTDTDNSLTCVMFMNTLGLSILVDALKSSAYFLNGSNGIKIRRYNYSVGSSSVAFIQGTGLELMLQTYHMEYDADELRTNFFSLFHKREYIS